MRLLGARSVAHWWIVGILLLVATACAHAAEQQYRLLLDTDNNAATGCLVAAGGTSAPGVETVVTAVVNTTTTSVTVVRLDRQTCTAGVLGAPVTYNSGGWSVGLGNGTGGASVVESFVSLASLPTGTLKAWGLGVDSNGATDWTAPFFITIAAGGPTVVATPIPLSPWILLPLALGLLGIAVWLRRRYPNSTAMLALVVIVGATGLAWAATVVLDGNVNDWLGVGPAVTDPKGDAPANADIVAVFDQQDAQNLYLRFDVGVQKDVAGNQPPVVNAGPDQSITLPAVANLSGTASDDGLPNPPGVLTTTWSTVSGPGTVVFGNIHALATTATFSAAGTYVLQLTANDSALSTSDTLQVVVTSAPPGNQPPVVSAGPDQTITLPAVANLSGTASDDGLPNPPGVLTTTWSTVSGPGTVVFGNVHALATTATFSVSGPYVLRLTASDSALSTSSALNVTVNDVSGAGPQLAPIANQTIALGSRFQQLLQATSPNVNETLTLTLPTAPAGAALSPPPLIDWTPTAAQLGLNSFTAKVTDSHGLSAMATFTVTVTHVDQPPQLAPQADESVRIGTPFTRLLKASDPDAGDTLTFALVSGPAGMVLNGANLSWPTLGVAIGDYPVTVKVTDASGLSDTKSFTIKLLPVVIPVAVDDNYSVRLGETLTVAAPGVLANDLASGGTSLSSVKITNPDKGTLNNFNADGSFSYTAPAIPAGPVFAPVLKWNSAVQFWAGNSNPLVADVFANGKPVVFAVRRVSEGGITAIDGATGTTLWTVTGELPAPNTGCYMQGDVTPENQTADSIAVGDIDDSGIPAVVTSAKCLVDGSQGTRMIALNARTGAVKWLTPPLGVLINNSGGLYFGMTYGITPTIARLHAAESPSVLFKVDAEGYLDNPATQRSCDQFQVNSGLNLCTGVLALNGVDGSVRQRFIAPNDNVGRENAAGGHLMVADLTGSGTLNLVANGAVWDADGTLISNRLGAQARSIALAKLDDSGQISIVSYELSGVSFIVARHADGTVQWQTPIDTSTVQGLLSVADLDGDGSPEIMATAEGNLYVYGANGQIKWSHRYADSSNQRTIDVGKRPAAFDLAGDGVAEVIIPTTFGVEFTDGATGKTKKTLTWADLGVTNTGYGGGYAGAYSTSAVVADIDGSGHAAIVITIPAFVYGADQYVVAIGAANNDWRPAPTVFNEFSYHVTNVDNIGHIPTVEVNAFATPRTNIFGTQAQTQPPVDPRVYQGTAFTYAASNGTQTSDPAKVTIDIRPQNRPPVFTSVAPTVYVPVAFTYAAHATDPDPGDSVTYSLLLPVGNGAPSCSVNATSGLVTCVNLFAGEQFFTVVATDTQGASAFQSVHLVQSVGPATVPNVVGQSKSAADAALTAAGFVTGNVSSIYYAAPADQVLTQYPAAGATALAGSAIALQVSLGLPPQAVPDVIGLQLSVARTRLTGFGFGTIVVPVTSATAPAGEVVAQNPVFGTLLAPPSPVTVSVSIGPPLSGTVAQVIVQPGPTALRVAGESLNYTATAVFTDGTSADVTIASLWDTSAPAVASVDSTGSAKALTPGPSIISAKAGGVTGQSTLTVVARNTGDNVTPVAQITTPADGASVSGPTSVTGTATDANFLRYELAVALAGDTTWTVISEGTTTVTAGTLGTLDPTTLVNDLYTLRLTVFDTNSNQTVATSTVQVTGGQKPGLFTLAYQDLTVPATGIPVTVTRTYDSRDKATGEFGVGWRLGFQSLRLRTNRVPGTGWVRQNAGATVNLIATSEHKVSVTLTDGKVEEFDLVLSPTSGFGGLDETVVSGYAARAGTLGKLEMLGNPNLLILNSGAEDELVDDTTLGTFDPANYRYIAPDGKRFEINRSAGVTKITDLNGNSVTFGPGGIIHSSGQSIAFVRDSQGRITQVTDPLGHTQTYTYDGNGDLVSHANATGGSSHYRYDRNHGLIDIQDPAGNHAARNTFDAAGHLLSTTDANGHQITYANDEGSQTEIITDRQGVVTQIQYDGMGNVTSTQTGVTIEGVLVLAKTAKTYDALGNETSLIDPDGMHVTSSYNGPVPQAQSVDPGGLNLGTSFAFDAAENLTSMNDSGGRTFAFSYDGNGNLIGTNIPGIGAATIVNDGQGQAAQRVDALSNTTALTRDPAGNIIREDVLDASSNLLRRTDFTYDAGGNKLSETLYRHIGAVLTPLTTQFAYDAANRVIAVTDPAGSVSQAQYDANGHVTDRTDPLGRHTAYTYDAVGNLTRTTMPDGTVLTRTYDGNGNLATSADAVGRITTYAYDELNRQVRITLADGSSTQTVYSPGGSVVATIDASGNRTDYGYDTAGRQISSTFPAVTNGPGGPLVRPQMATTLGALGAPVSTTDPNGRITTYQYDANGRLVQKTFPGGATTQQTFDALGRRLSATNEEGQTTTFSYDGLGRLVGVSGLDGNATYAYDEADNLITQTDALGRVTRFSYDVLNRLTQRQYPAGETERFAYDAVGNVIARIDGMGRSTSFAYDTMNRVTSKVLPGGVTIAYSYTPDGHRASVTDPRGVTSYGYDSLGRLASVAHPTGETVQYARDTNGNLQLLASPAGSVNYSYDALNRLVQISAPEGTSQAFYDLAGNRLRQTAANGVVTDATFDVRDRPTLLTHKKAATTLQSYASTYSPSGRRTQVAEVDGSVENYAYDSNGRLVSEVRTGINPLNITHSYDAVGNRLNTVVGGTPTTFSYDTDDRLLADGTSTYAWDANGNLVSKTQGTNVVNFGYDPENQLLSITGGGLANQYTYDADGNRVQVSSAVGTTRFLVDAANNTGLSQVLEEKDGSGTLQARYSYGNELLAMTRGGNTAFQIRDAFGSTRALADASATLTDRYQYDAYGNSVSAVGATVNPYRYRGERLDVDSGLYQLRARYYDPRAGRFTARDPYEGEPESPVSRHRYAYANADPVNQMDPTGLDTLPELILANTIQDSIDVIDTLNRTRVVCTNLQRLEAAGYMYMLAELGVTAYFGTFIGYSAGLAAQGAQGGKIDPSAPTKTAFTAFGINPIRLFGSAKTVKSMQVRLEIPFALKLSTTFQNSLSFDTSFGIADFAVAGGLSQKIVSISSCGAPLANLNLKGRIKGSKGLTKDSSIGMTLSGELEFLGAFRYEFPIWDGSLSYNKKLKGSNKILGF